MWVAASLGDRVPVLALVPGALLYLEPAPNQVDAVRSRGPDALDHRHVFVMPLPDVQRIMVDGPVGLRILRHRADEPVDLAFTTPAERDHVFASLHRMLAPQAAVQPYRRSARELLEPWGGTLLLLGIGFGFPYMVEAGQISRAHWAVTSVYNRLGPMGFRLLGLVLAALCVVWFVARVRDNPVRYGISLRGLY
ncbi:MAG: hypothetical protein ACR2HR_18570 [Euzebya sp.]